MNVRTNEQQQLLKKNLTLENFQKKRKNEMKQNEQQEYEEENS